MNLQVHLNGGDAFLRAGNFEVHVAEEVFKALNIDHGHEAVALGHKTAGDAGNRRFNRHACRHQRQGRTANRALGSGTVGGKHFGDHTDAVGEFFHRRNDRQQRAFCERTVTDFTSARASRRLGFADGVGREVVVVHIAFFSLAVDAVKQLAVAHRPEGRNRKALRLAAGEHARAVYAGKQVDFGVQRTDFINASAVHTFAVVQKPAANDEFLQFVKAVFNLRGVFGVNFVEFCVYRFINGFESFVTDAFVVGVERGAHVVNREFFNRFIHFFRRVVRREFNLFLADFVADAFDEFDNLLVGFVTEHNAVKHHVVGHFVCARFNHRDQRIGGSDGNRHLGNLTLCLGRVDDIFAVHKTDGNTADRAVPRNFGNADGNGNTDHRGDFR